MADLGTILFVTVPTADTPVWLVPDPANYVANGLTVPYGEIVSFVLNPVPSMSILGGVVEAYSIAGTALATYQGPVVGQLWPRGDLDALANKPLN